MISRALNQKTAPNLPFPKFLDLAKSLGCVGVEPRNDLGRPFFDGAAPKEAAEMARQRGLRLLGLSEVYPFNDWNDERARQVQGLIDVAQAAGAETISLIPRVDGKRCEDGVRQRDLRNVMRQVLPMLEGRDVVALIEPIGFSGSSLRRKAELVEAIEAVGGTEQFKLVHDTFQHAIAGETEIFSFWTGIVHISGISDPTVPMDETQDAHRVLIDAGDRCGNAAQVRAFLDAGYSGGFSFECTDVSVQDSLNREAEIAASFRYLESAVTE
ncbi:TIM barrel protein [Pseudoruegeria sp. HB172150]|uniref:TIM barrel protein n=1 Tax=Pseudoruegeria sp. HB172150 TaxID=2721164 RepID=UPI001C131988|nr:TIM barrel protein [Pseudoruegeria sp. HB172150]